MSIIDRLLGTESDDESCCDMKVEEIDAEKTEETASDSTANE